MAPLDLKLFLQIIFSHFHHFSNQSFNQYSSDRDDYNHQGFKTILALKPHYHTYDRESCAEKIQPIFSIDHSPGLSIKSIP